MSIESTDQNEDLVQQLSRNGLYYSPERIKEIFSTKQTKYTPEQLEHLDKTLPIALRGFQHIRKAIENRDLKIKSTYYFPNTFRVEDCMLVPSPSIDVCFVDKSLFVGKPLRINITQNGIIIEGFEKRDGYLGNYLVQAATWMIIRKKLFRQYKGIPSWEKTLRNMDLNRKGYLSMFFNHSKNNSQGWDLHRENYQNNGGYIYTW